MEAFEKCADLAYHVKKYAWASADALDGFIISEMLAFDLDSDISTLNCLLMMTHGNTAWTFY